ncbi:MAG: nucleotide pyrophosphohydrolase [Bacteriovoracaceae bacterium]
METLDLAKVKKFLESFAQQRGWEQFHDPKNLAMALTVESAELLELFQWLRPEQGYNYKNKDKEKVEDELADIILYAIRMSSQLDINLVDAIEKKMKKNEMKYPIEKSQNIAKELTGF